MDSPVSSPFKESRLPPLGTTIEESAPLEEGIANVVVADTEQPETSSWRQWILRWDPAMTTLITWATSILLILFLVAVVFGIFYSGFTYRRRPDSTSDCDEPFGIILGVHDGVFGYSNCNDQYVSAKPSMIPFILGGVPTEVYSGMMWQCVEYARRYWLLHGSVVLPDVEGAADIWNVKEVAQATNPSVRLGLHRYENGLPLLRGGRPPMVRDLLIYDRRGKEFPFGHVAVIVEVSLTEPAHVKVAEQNWQSVQWVPPYHNYSRSIPLDYDSSLLLYKLHDEGPILGWMRFGA